MGLDMYLRAQKYVSGYSFSEQAGEYTSLVEQFGVGEYVDPDTPSAYVEFTVAYWRKANQVHNWFVRECQGGRDECQETDVSREQLKKLRELCLRVLALPTKDEPVQYGHIGPGGTLTEVKEKRKGLTAAAKREAAQLLPTASGFFFGDTEYGPWYREDVELTVKQLDRALAMPEDWYFVYQSSW